MPPVASDAVEDEGVRASIVRLIAAARAYASAELGVYRSIFAFRLGAARTVAILGAIAALLATIATVLLFLALVFALAPIVGAAWAAVIVAGVALLIAGVLASIMLRTLRLVTDPIETLS